MELYSQLARFYDLENADLTDDIPFWLELARECGGPVLELGCGTGRITLQLAREGFRVTGVDSSPDMLARGRAKLARNPNFAANITWIEADFRKLDLGASFPLIIAPFNTLTHLLEPDDLRGALSVIQRHLAPGGSFIFDLPNPAEVYGNLPEGLVLERVFADDDRKTKIQQFSTLRVDRLAQRGEITWYYDELDSEGRVTRTTIPMTVRYFFPAEIELLLDAHGMQLASLWGDFDRSALDDESPKIIAAAKKK